MKGLSRVRSYTYNIYINRYMHIFTCVYIYISQHTTVALCYGFWNPDLNPKFQNRRLNEERTCSPRYHDERLHKFVTLFRALLTPTQPQFAGSSYSWCLCGFLPNLLAALCKSLRIGRSMRMGPFNLEGPGVSHLGV